MWETFFNWLGEKYPMIFLLIIVGAIVWIVAKLYYRRFIPIEEHHNQLKQVANCKNHTQDISTLKNSIKNIERILIRKDSSVIDQLSFTHSPRQLSDSGLKLYELSGAKEVFEQNIDTFILNLEARNPNSALDVETEAHSVCLSLSDMEMFKSIKTFIFNNPKFDNTDVDINTICFVMSIVLRDQYFLKHPEIELE